MKKSILFSFAAAVLFLASGCSEKFDVAAPYKDITVVYGLLDQKDTAHYVRIQKAFLDQDKSSVAMAKEPDSSYYKNINVRIERLRFDRTLFDTIHLNRVDLNNEGYPKEPGIFFTSPNYAYKFKDVLNPNYIYRIKVINYVTGVVDSSETPIIEDVAGSKAFVFRSVDDFNTNKDGLDFAKTTSFSTTELLISYSPPSAFNFNGQTSPVLFAQCIVRMNWRDSNIASQQKTVRYTDFDAGYLIMNSVNKTFEIKNISLYNALASGMGSAPENVVRLLDRFELFAYLGTQDYYTYLQANLVKGSGLTGSEIQPVYTNIKGPNTLGLFTCRASHSGQITLTRNTVDSLMASPILTNAKIRGVSYF